MVRAQRVPAEKVRPSVRRHLRVRAERDLEGQSEAKCHQRSDLGGGRQALVHYVSQAAQAAAAGADPPTWTTAAAKAPKPCLGRPVRLGLLGQAGHLLGKGAY